MSLSAGPPAPVLEALARGATILTANQRAARMLRHAFDRHNAALGLATWQPPAILAWDTWTAALWHSLLLEGRATALLLNPTQEHTLWRSVIASDSNQTSLRPIDALAETAASAWSLLHAYRARTRLAAAAGTADTRAFAHWATAFERLCRDRDYVTPAQLPEALRTAIAANHIVPPASLFLVGFDTKTPTQMALLDALAAAGTSISEPTSDVPTDTPILTFTQDEPSELTTAARWIRTHLTHHPQARIAVIVPNLDADRTEIARTFGHILAPELEDIAEPTASGPFEFSLGLPLARTPLIATALDLLRWTAAPLPLERVSALLLSPHLATTPSELLARAEFDAFELRRQSLLRPEISLQTLNSLASGWRHASRIPALTRHLRFLLTQIDCSDLSTNRTHAEWASTIHDLVTAAGWAVPVHLDSIEFQTRRKWESTLDELATLDFNPDAPRIPFQTALDELQRIATSTLFAPESRNAPIQIIGPLESAGSNFDALWFLRASDLGWPTTSATNPLLPWSLQRDLAMPGANPAYDSALARRITARIAASAPTAIFSYALQSSESHQRPSPALTSLALQTVPASTLAPDIPPEPPITLEAFSDDVPITPLPDGILTGGASILKSQAACAFRAFAEKRLFSSAPESRELGLDARERGNLIHTVLEDFWAHVESQANLRALSIPERRTRLAESIDHALNTHLHTALPGWDTAYLDAERQRLTDVLLPWLDFELTRAPFTVQSREETLQDVQIGPLRLNVRVDRVDRVVADPSTNSPGEIILDYKTGSAKPADWLGPRPDEPQLPLYAVLAQSAATTESADKAPPLAALAFVNIRAGKDLGLSGFEAHPGILPKSARLKAPSLDAQVDAWRAVLTSLAEDFSAGHSEALPKQYPTTCRHCDQRLLCRLDLADLQADALEDFLDETDPAPAGSPAQVDISSAPQETDRG